MKELQKRLSELISLMLLRVWLVKEGYDPVFGAGPLRRAIRQHLENPISTRILDGELAEGDIILVDFVADGLMISKK